VVALSLVMRYMGCMALASLVDGVVLELLSVVVLPFGLKRNTVGQMKGLNSLLLSYSIAVVFVLTNVVVAIVIPDFHIGMSHIVMNRKAAA